MDINQIINESLLLELFNFGICIVDDELNVKYWNSWLAYATKIHVDEILNEKLDERFMSLDDKKLKRQIKVSHGIESPTFYKSKKGYLFPIKLEEITNPTYEYMQQHVTIYPLDKNNSLITINDQTALKEASQKMEDYKIVVEEQKKLFVDKLTQLPNRTKLIQLAHKDRYKKLALININGFNEINDFFGFSIGDSYLIYIAKELQKHAQKYNFQTYKLPSDEYALYHSTNEMSEEKFKRVVEIIIKDIERGYYQDEEHKIAIFFSCGISFDEKNIFRTADMALKKSKKNNINVVIYDESINTDKIIREKHKWLEELKHGIENNKLLAYYQPIYNIQTQKIEKYETLIRLIGRNNEVFVPFFFLGVAKQAKLYNTITEVVIMQSFETFKDNDYEFSINLSVEDLKHISSIELLMDKLKKNPDIAKRVVIELLEDEGFENFDMLKSFIQEVKALGVRIAIDDFGTGYSNFSYLLKLQVDYLKIDASLIKNIHNDSNSLKIVETLVDFSKKMGAKVIAEYVHNAQVFETISALGIDYAQGYYIGKPSDVLTKEAKWTE